MRELFDTTEGGGQDTLDTTSHIKDITLIDGIFYQLNGDPIQHM